MFPLFRDIVIREQIEIVHAHQDSSPMSYEALFHAHSMGLKTCFTSHSLFNIYDVASIHLNKILVGNLASVSKIIAVSNTCRVNLIERFGLRTEKVTTIPNAVDASYFTPDPSLKDPFPTINIIVINRMVYRKGADLLAQVVPRICLKYPNVNFIIGGDGPKRLLLDEMRERYQLHDRVELLGSIPHTEVRQVLCRGSLFLNCSLTESFCIAILEAASCGLFVVSTRVGGIPEILPPDMISFAASPSADDIVSAISVALESPLDRDPFECHSRVKDMYSWNDVAMRTCMLYDDILSMKQLSFTARLHFAFDAGPVAGLLNILFIAVDAIILSLLDWWRPKESIEIVHDCSQELMK